MITLSIVSSKLMPMSVGPSPPRTNVIIVKNTIIQWSFMIGPKTQKRTQVLLRLLTRISSMNWDMITFEILSYIGIKLLWYVVQLSIKLVLIDSLRESWKCLMPHFILFFRSLNMRTSLLVDKSKKMRLRMEWSNIYDMSVKNFTNKPHLARNLMDGSH